MRALDVEIDARFGRSQFRNWGLQALTMNAIPEDFAERLFLAPGPNRAMMPQFAGRWLKSLLYELSTLTPPAEQESLKVALELVRIGESQFLGRPFTLADLPPFTGLALRLYKLRWDCYGQFELDPTFGTLEVKLGAPGTE